MLKKIIVLTVFAVLGVQSAASAAWIYGDPYGRAYSIRRYNPGAVITGAKTSLSGGWSKLSPGLATANPNGISKIINNMWVVFEGPPAPCYLETYVESSNTTAATAANLQAQGVATAISPSYRGYGISITSANPSNGNPTVTWYAIGSNNSAVSQAGGTIEAYKFSPTAWQIKFNNTVVLTPLIACPVGGGIQGVFNPVAARAVDAGIESNDTTNTFTNMTTKTLQVKTANTSYAFPPSMVDASGSPFTWYTNYVPATGTVEMRR
jgi:hypothetical protein